MHACVPLPAQNHTHLSGRRRTTSARHTTTLLSPRPHIPLPSTHVPPTHAPPIRPRKIEKLHASAGQGPQAAPPPPPAQELRNCRWGEPRLPPCVKPPNFGFFRRGQRYGISYKCVSYIENWVYSVPRRLGFALWGCTSAVLPPPPRRCCRPLAWGSTASGAGWGESVITVIGPLRRSRPLLHHRRLCRHRLLQSHYH